MSLIDTLLARRPREEQFTSRLRSLAVTARVGRILGILIVLTFVTGWISHVSQEPGGWFFTRPTWGYRLTQGLHVIAGTATVPLLLVKLWSVYPRLFQASAGSPRDRSAWSALARQTAERLAVAALVAATIFQLVSGALNSAQWYPWAFSFRSTHYAVAWIVIGALALHIGLRWGQIREGLRDRRALDDGPPEGPTRRTLLRSTWVASGLAAVAVAGGTISPLRSLAVFSSRSGTGPGGVPINRTAAAAGVTEAATGSAFRLVLAAGDREVSLSLADLRGLPQHTERLPIACVEGWSAMGTWTGVRVADLLSLLEVGPSDLRVTSLQQRGAFSVTELPSAFAADPLTLLALDLDGEALSLDHGYPCRIIAPNRPGVLQTKWVQRLEVIG